MTVTTTINSSASGQWNKIMIEESKELVKVNINLKQTSESKISNALCMYAAISDAPEFNKSTVIRRFHNQESQISLQWDGRPSNLYIQYPLDRNYVIQLGGKIVGENKEISYEEDP